VIPDRPKFSGDLFIFGWLGIFIWLDQAAEGMRRLHIHAELRKERVDNRHVEKRKRQQENRHPAAQMTLPHRTLKRLQQHKYPLKNSKWPHASQTDYCESFGAVAVIGVIGR